LTNNVVAFERGLPVVVYDVNRVSKEQVYEVLYRGYVNYYNEKPDKELVLSWRSTLPIVLNASDGYPVIIEYPVLDGLERIDYIVVGRKKALVIEAKSWFGEYKRVSDYIVSSQTLNELRIDPCYQLKNYIAKFKHLHTAGSRLDFQGVVYAHGFKYVDDCSIIESEETLLDVVSKLDEPGSPNEVHSIVNGKFQISKAFVEFVKQNKEKLRNKAIEVLLTNGYGLTEKQLVIVNEVLEALEKGVDKAFFIHGVSGSGKTLIALTLFFEALSRRYSTILAYKNNRLLNTLRLTLGPELSGLISFYSIGPPRYGGVAERNFPTDKYGRLDLVIYDEAQRMRDENIELSLIRSRVKVYLYDEEQVLLGYESGYTRNFLEKARSSNVEYVFYELARPARIPYTYLQAVRNLLSTGRLEPRFKAPEFKVYDDIRVMLNELKQRHNEGRRIALVAAFTETPGNKKDRGAPDNLRVGYPLCRKYYGFRCVEYSDLNIYSNTGLKIYWLMDEKNEYPRYWMGELGDPLKYCASVYGAQGFETEYVGVIWGRDFIWRSGKWEVNPNVITDYVGDEYSLKNIAQKDRERARELLINRYKILLTRGMKGVYVFFEDKETYEHIRKQLIET